MTIDLYITKLRDMLGDELSGNDIKLIRNAYELAKLSHHGQKRASGEDYFEAHCIPVSINVASLDMPASMIAAALLHDSVEDTEMTLVQIANVCGPDVASLVDGVTKLGKIKYHGNERHVESLRKFFVAIAQDARVVILKLCDRWHNLTTLHHLPEHKRQRIALESLLIYAPLASRMGMGKLAMILSDLSFPYAEPENYQKTLDLMKEELAKAELVIKQMYEALPVLLKPALGYEPKIDKRVKTVYSLYKKLERKEWRAEDIHDIVALRIIVKDISECYQVLGVIHANWQPLPGRVKDYIAIPKPNGYKSLHTTVMSGSDVIVEVQIRTPEMHSYNEFGVASHHSYKNRHKAPHGESFNWLSQLSELDDESLTPDEYVSALTTDFFADRIFALTPKGDVIDLPVGATVLDFAFQLHTDIGARAIGGRMNGTYRSLNTVILPESVVEIVTGPKPHPSEKWLSFVKTSYAKNKIHRMLLKHKKS